MNCFCKTTASARLWLYLIQNFVDQRVSGMLLGTIGRVGALRQPKSCTDVGDRLKSRVVVQLRFGFLRQQVSNQQTEYEESLTNHTRMLSFNIAWSTVVVHPEGISA